MLVAIDSGYFYAGAIIENGICIEAAPILKWMIGKKEEYLKNYCLNKNWKTYIASYE